MRALLTALDQWVREGTEPPASRVPRVDQATAVSRESLEAQYTKIPGSAWLTHLPQRLRMAIPVTFRGVLHDDSGGTGAWDTSQRTVDQSTASDAASSQG